MRVLYATAERQAKSGNTVRASAAMRVLYATAELYPWVKAGGLGDVSAALPPALAAEGADVRLLLPGFPGFLDAFAGIGDAVRLRTPFAEEPVRLALARLPGGKGLAYLVDQPALYDRPGGPYADATGHDWPDNHRRFALFGWAAAALARGADPLWRPDIVHAHDWHAALAPVYLAAAPPVDRPVRSVFTIHNLAYRGLFAAAQFGELALPLQFFAVDGIEFYGGLSFLKAGLVYADRLTTVSPTYAREIQSPAFGWGLDGVLRRRSDALSGILHGVDPEIWDPGHDPALPRAYGRADADAGKGAAKAALCARLGLADEDDPAVFGVVSRLTPQKGLDLLLAVVPDLVAGGGRLALIGAGDADLEDGFAAAAAAHPGRVATRLGYDEELSHLIIGGADVILVPSRFEPCGLTQLYALRYGSLPLVRRTGGLADTVVDATSVTLADGSATGFAFGEESPPALWSALLRSRSLRAERPLWRRMVERAMTRDFTWAAAAGRYLDLYRGLQPAS
jgi:starch synthase